MAALHTKFLLLEANDGSSWLATHCRFFVVFPRFPFGTKLEMPLRVILCCRCCRRLYHFPPFQFGKASLSQRPDASGRQKSSGDGDKGR